MDLNFSKPEIKQGDTAIATISMDSSSAQALQNLKLVGQNLADSLYIYEVSPLMRKQGEDIYHAKIKLIFVKIPKTNSIRAQVGNEVVEVRWNNISLIPTETPPELIFEKYELPTPPQVALMVGILIVVLLLGWLGLALKKKWGLKSKIKTRKAKIKQDVLGCKSYEDVVLMWKNKREYIEVFPHLTSAFEKLETTLFSYQFKPTQSSTEKEAVMRAYRDFCSAAEGGFSGI